MHILHHFSRVSLQNWAPGALCDSWLTYIPFIGCLPVTHSHPLLAYHNSMNFPNKRISLKFLPWGLFLGEPKLRPSATSQSHLSQNNYPALPLLLGSTVLLLCLKKSNFWEVSNLTKVSVRTRIRTQDSDSKVFAPSNKLDFSRSENFPIIYWCNFQ